MWTGAAAVCVNERLDVLMVLQGRPDEDKTWSVPSGGRNWDETYEQCCAREVLEETGYVVAVGTLLRPKNDSVRYFAATVVGGGPKIDDPDGLIYDIAWKSQEEICSLELTYPEDREFLLTYLCHQAEK